jgi:YD repeat-containing protein
MLPKLYAIADTALAGVRLVQYRNRGDFNRAQWASGTLTRSYDPARGWLTNLTAAQSGVEKLNLSYTYLPNGRLQSVTDTVNPAQSASYGYDGLNRLKTAVSSEWGLSWSYDEFGNRTAQTTTLGTPPGSALAYDPATNRITTSGYNYSDNTPASGRRIGHPTCRHEEEVARCPR